MADAAPLLVGPMRWATPLRVALVYGVISAAYIFLSDRLTLSFSQDPQIISRIQTYKGWGYQLFVCLLIYVLLTLAYRAAAASQAAQRESQRALQTLISNLPGIVYRATLDARWTPSFVGGSCREITGYECQAFLAGDVNFDDLVEPEHRQRVRHEISQAVAAHRPFEIVYAIRHADGSRRWLWGRGQLVGELRDAVIEGFATDITQLRQAQEALAQNEERARALADSRTLLLHELEHRVRNNLASLLSLIALYERSTTDVPQFARSISDKIMAMKTVHELTTNGAGGHVDFTTLLRRVAGQFIDDPASTRIAFSGPAIDLHIPQVAPLTMVFQELMTNSRKHGALSTASGRVEAAWELTGDDAQRVLTIGWRESGGPPANPAARAGLGLSLVRGFVEHELRGRAHFAFDPTGFHCTLEIPAHNPPA